jgi:hypothetical protein
VLRVDRKQNLLKAMSHRSLSEAGYLERQGLQQLICRSPELFFGELREDLLLLGQEVCPAEMVDDRIDVLALDRQGAVVVIELKRGANPFQLLQGISYAAMISDWSIDDLVEVHRVTHSLSAEESKERIEEFLSVDIAQVNGNQRVILIAEGFDLEVLAAARWLARGDVDIRCHRLILSADESDDILSCSCVFPLAQLEDHVRQRSRRSHAAPDSDWQTTLGDVKNPAVREFILAEALAGQESNFRVRSVIYRLKGRRRFHVGARRDRAYVWQNGRFAGDIQWWRKRLGDDLDIAPVDNDDCLRFYLVTEAAFAAFKQALEHELGDMEFLETAGELIAAQSSEITPPVAGPPPSR